MPSDVAGPTFAQALGTSPGAVLLWLDWAPPGSSLTAQPACDEAPTPKEVKLVPPSAQAPCFPCQWAPPPASHLGLPLPSPPLPAPLRPLGSNRSSCGQNTISSNKLNLLRLLIMSGVGSDQRERRLQPQGSLW